MDSHQPDVVILDVRLPGISGIAAIGRLAEIAPGAGGGVLRPRRPRAADDAIGAGAHGYVLKGSPVTDLLRAVRAVAAGDPYMDPALSPTLMLDIGRGGAPMATARAGRFCSCWPMAWAPPTWPAASGPSPDR